MNGAALPVLILMVVAIFAELWVGIYLCKRLIGIKPFLIFAAIIAITLTAFIAVFGQQHPTAGTLFIVFIAVGWPIGLCALTLGVLSYFVWAK